MRRIRYRSRLTLAAVVAVALPATVVTALATAPAATAAAGCRVAYSVTSQWPSGFGANVTVTNLGDPLTSWRVSWSFAAGQTITQLWNGTATQSGAQVTVSNAAWNGAIGTGAGTAFGFNGSWNASNPVPTAFALNGTACTGSVTSGTPSATAGSRSPSTSPTASVRPTASVSASSPTSGVLAQVNTAGRVATVGAAVQYTWPGVYFEGRFHGASVGIVLNDSTNDYDVQVDGAPFATLVTPGQTTYWVTGLSNADHSVRLVKRTESPWATGEFGGFVAASGGAILAKPAARSRQIEFIGDSFTAGYGNVSGTRDCSSNGGITRNSNADLSFAALTARSLGADYQLNAQSGLGMVRNYAGGSPELNFRTYYDRGLQSVAGDVWQNPGAWKPQVVVIGLGINDFSTALNSNEQWPTTDSLVAAYRTAYLDFIAKLRSRYGAKTMIVVSATLLSNTTLFAQTAQQIVQDRTNAGDSRVGYWYYDDPGLDRLGCDWHPSVHDDQIISGLLNSYLATLSLTW